MVRCVKTSKVQETTSTPTLADTAALLAFTFTGQGSLLTGAGESTTFNVTATVELGEKQVAENLLTANKATQTQATETTTQATQQTAQTAQTAQTVLGQGFVGQQQQLFHQLQQTTFVKPLELPVAPQQPELKALTVLPAPVQQQVPAQTGAAAAGEMVGIPVLQGPQDRLQLVYVSQSLLGNLTNAGYELRTVPTTQLPGVQTEQTPATVQVPVVNGQMYPFQYTGAQGANVSVAQAPIGFTPEAAATTFLYPAAQAPVQAPTQAPTQVQPAALSAEALAQYPVVQHGNEYFYMVPYSQLGAVFPEQSLLVQSEGGFSLPDVTLLNIASGFRTQQETPLTVAQVAERLSNIIAHLDGVAGSGLPKTEAAEEPATEAAAEAKPEAAKPEETSASSELAEVLRAFMKETDEE